MTFGDLKNFHQKYIKDKKFNIAVVGDEKKMNFQALGKYGKVNKLSLDEVFGYEEYKKDVKGWFLCCCVATFVEQHSNNLNQNSLPSHFFQITRILRWVREILLLLF